ncbi:MAG: type I-E CRISPR-associated endoribonuclease Cas2e [Planctomycetota bacterium]|nr:type I-E CRISPR-associated endoribonuclease Cas2e [Planctomycetota bacterium]
MLVFILERVSPALRGELTRWLVQPHTGVFVGTVSARVRQRLWERICKAMKCGAAIMIYPVPTEQGFTIETSGKTKKVIEDFEGLKLAKTRVSG